MPAKCITLYLQHCGCHSFLINFVKHFLKKGWVIINSKSVKGNFLVCFYIYIMSCTFVIFYRIYCNEYLLWFLQLWSMYQLSLPLLDVFSWLDSSLLFLSTRLNSTLLLSCVCVCVCVCMHVCMRMRVHAHACMHVCVCMHTCTYMHIHDQYSSRYDSVLLLFIAFI